MKPTYWRTSALFPLFFYDCPKWFFNWKCEKWWIFISVFTLEYSVQKCYWIMWCKHSNSWPGCKRKIRKRNAFFIMGSATGHFADKKSASIFPHIERIAAENKLPSDLKYIPLIKSTLRAHARSLKGAVGYWQFLKSTGKWFGLRIDSQIDERRNVFKSIAAAGRYLKVLEKQYLHF